jgi:hypothetical protein
VVSSEWSCAEPRAKSNKLGTCERPQHVVAGASAYHSFSSLSPTAISSVDSQNAATALNGRIAMKTCSFPLSHCSNASPSFVSSSFLSFLHQTCRVVSCRQAALSAHRARLSFPSIIPTAPTTQFALSDLSFNLTGIASTTASLSTTAFVFATFLPHYYYEGSIVVDTSLACI